MKYFGNNIMKVIKVMMKYFFLFNMKPKNMQLKQNTKHKYISYFINTTNSTYIYDIINMQVKQTYDKTKVRKTQKRRIVASRKNIRRKLPCCYPKFLGRTLIYIMMIALSTFILDKFEIKAEI